MTGFDVSSDAACRRDPHGCITCGDEGIPMRVLAIDEARALALCETAAGERSTVEIALVDAGPGDEVLVHAGTAIA
ncbi:MAG: HupF/HypC family [Pseudonocardiales bacterium]|nr:HupF/HypC family [Pseudonocardiales bacterium]